MSTVANCNRCQRDVVDGRWCGCVQPELEEAPREREREPSAEEIEREDLERARRHEQADEYYVGEIVDG